MPVFDNRTEEIGIERIFTNALIRELQSRGEIVLGERKGGALELRGAIGGIGGDPTAYTPSGFRGLQGYRRLPTEYGVSVGISLSLVDLETQKVLWSGGFSGFRRVQGPVDRTHNYEAPSSVGLITQSILESKYTEIAGDIMRDVYDEMVELF